VYAAGSTFSTDFPLNDSLAAAGGAGDAFAIKLSPAGDALQFSI
jgi:hypothetical protein